MTHFSYKALNRAGKELSGKIERRNIKEVEDFLRVNDYLIIEIKKTNVLTKDLSEFDIFLKQFSSKELFLFCRQLAFILSSGVTLDRALGLVKNYSKDKIKTKKILNIKEDILKGESFSDSLEKQKIFPQFLISMTKVGEKTGNISKIMEELADFYEKQNKFESSFANAMVYPFIVSMATLFLILASFIYVVPSFNAIFKSNGLSLPPITKFIVKISEVMISKQKIIFIFLFIFILLSIIFSKSHLGKKLIDTIFLKISIYKKLYNYKFSGAMGILIEAGVSIGESLEVSKEIINNIVVINFIENSILEIKKGEPLSKVLNNKYIFEELVYEMIFIGEELGKVYEVMEKSKKYLEIELESSIEKMSKLVEPVFTIILGGILLIIVLAIILPTFSLAEGLL